MVQAVSSQWSPSLASFVEGSEQRTVLPKGIPDPEAEVHMSRAGSWEVAALGDVHRVGKGRRRETCPFVGGQ